MTAKRMDAPWTVSDLLPRARPRAGNPDSTPCGITQRLAHLGEARRLELGDLSPKSSSWDGVNIVEVDDTIGWNTVVGCQLEL